MIVASQYSRTWPINILAMRRPTAVPTAALWQEGALVSRHVNHVCSSGIATPIANGIIGRSTKKSVNNVPPSYTTRRCSRTLRPRRTVPFASYQCQRDCYLVRHFHLRLYHPYQFVILLMQMRSWQVRLRKHIFPVVEKAFVAGACTPSVSLETMGIVRFVKQSRWTKLMQKLLMK